MDFTRPINNIGGDGPEGLKESLVTKMQTAIIMSVNSDSYWVKLKLEVLNYASCYYKYSFPADAAILWGFSIAVLVNELGGILYPNTATDIDGAFGQLESFVVVDIWKRHLQQIWTLQQQISLMVWLSFSMKLKGCLETIITCISPKAIGADSGNVSIIKNVLPSPRAIVARWISGNTERCYQQQKTIFGT